MEKSNELVSQAKLLFKAGKTAESLKMLKKAYALYPDQETNKKIDRMTAILESEIERVVKSPTENKEDKDNLVSRLETKAQEHFQNGDLKKALINLQDAYVLAPTNEKLARRISRIADALRQQQDEREQELASLPPMQPVNVVNSLLDRLIQKTGNLSIHEESKIDTPQKTLPVISENFENNLKIEQTNGKSAKEMLARARQVYEMGKTAEALQLAESAYCLDPQPKTALKIERLRAVMKQEKEEKEGKIDNQKENKGCGADPETTAVALEAEARQLFLRDQLTPAMEKLRQAYELHPTEKLQRTIVRMDQVLQKSLADEEGQKKPLTNRIDDLVRQTGNLSIHMEEEDNKNIGIEVAPGFSIPAAVHVRLYPYQREGVAWLWNLHNTSTGGILADDMGLGKTFQTIAFLTGYFLSEEATKKRRAVIIMAPVSVLNTWQSEFTKWAPSLKLFTYYEVSKVARLRGLAAIQRRGGIILTTYSMLVAGINDIRVDHTGSVGASGNFSTWRSSSPDCYGANDFTWDYLVLDEAHKIKNITTKIAKAVRILSSRHRLLLTGTAIQNNLGELWSLFDFTHSGQLLGSKKTFSTQYEKPIMRSRERDATAAERMHGNLMAESLRKMIDPYILRRTKSDVFKTTETNLSTVKEKAKLPRKNEIVVWVYLSQLQESIYRDFLKLDHVKELLYSSTKRSPLVELMILKKLCDHPRLLSPDQCSNLGLDMSLALPSARGEANTVHAPSSAALIQESSKLAFLIRLLEQFQEDALESGTPAHRTLVFSQSLRLLDMAELALLGVNKTRTHLPKHRILRLDGRLKKLSERLEVLDLFARDTSYTTMFLTVQVGGVGLTITSADRVVILDPSWNPAVDAQAVDRAYRIGQKSNVLVYRLITCATVEEKIYRRQVFKDSVIRHTMGDTKKTTNDGNKASDPYRYFTRQELRELFTLEENVRYSATQIQLNQLHGSEKRNTDEALEHHLSFVTGNKDIVFQISDHDLLFSCDDLEPPPSDDSTVPHEFVQRLLREGEEALRQEVTGSFKPEASGSIVNPTEKYTPANGVFFVPSKADSKRFMFNVAAKNEALKAHQYLDMTKEPIPKCQIESFDKLPNIDVRLSACVHNANESSINVSKDNDSSINLTGSLNLSSTSETGIGASLEDTYEYKEGLSEPSLSVEYTGSEQSIETGKTSQNLTQCMSPGRFAVPFANTSTPVGPGKQQPALMRLQTPKNRQVEIIDVDLSQMVDEAAIENSIQMISLRESLAKSGICFPEAIDLDISQVVDEAVIANSVQIISLRESLGKSGILLDQVENSEAMNSLNETADSYDVVDGENMMSVNISKSDATDQQQYPLVQDSYNTSKNIKSRVSCDISTSLEIIEDSYEDCE